MKKLVKLETQLRTSKCCILSLVGAQNLLGMSISAAVVDRSKLYGHVNHSKFAICN
jgi:hypothetical protein